MAENFSNLGKETHLGPGSRVPNKITQKGPHEDIVIKMAKVKEIILKAARGKQVTYKRPPLTPTALSLIDDFSANTLQARREWQEICKVLKERDPPPGILCLAG